MDMKRISFLISLAVLFLATPRYANAQSQIYPQHFNLDEVTLLDSPFKKAMDTNNALLLKYDVDRLLTPFIREAGLTKKSGKYYNWTSSHPSFSNWGLSSWSLEGHVGGHYLTALALAYAATDDQAMKTKLKERLDYMLDILKDCQDAYKDNTAGMKGFIGGQPITQIWTGLYKNDLTAFRQYGGWVPFYCQHKVLAGLRDAWLYSGSELARDLFKGLCDWSVNVVSKLSESDMQNVLGWEHGGMNEPLADAYRLFGEVKYLNAAVKYCHQYEVNGMQTLNKSFLDGQHANTQVPKFIGFERIYQEYLRDGKPSTATKYRTAAHNFWTDVANNRTVCIGGNSVSEHFLAASRGAQYIDNLEGPESCNSNNMLKLSEFLFDETHSAQYADFYESTMWNHILSTQDPQTGGYVYFTTLRPQAYRIYSKVNQGMWCCVGTGMENHAKYGHFIYTHSADNKTLYVNLFTPSKLNGEVFALTQQTKFPYEQKSTITIEKDGDFTLALRHPAWTTAGFKVTVNGADVNTTTKQGTASYVSINRSWKKGDVVELTLPMELRYEECPNYTDYIAFKYGPILLAAQTTAASATDAKATGLKYESLKNEYAGEGRMDHSPGAMASSLSLSSAPLLIGERSKVLSRITEDENSASTLSFTIDASSDKGTGGWKQMKLVPFYTIHHARYQCYWYQQTEEGYLSSDMGKADAEAAALAARTMDYVATGEQQSEAGHDALYTNSSSGNYQNEIYRDCSTGGFIQYTLANPDHKTDSLAVMCRFTTADKGRKCKIYIDGKLLVEGYTVPSSVTDADGNGFYNVEFPIPADMMYDAQGNVKSSIVFRIVPDGTQHAPGLYYLRLVSGFDSHEYVFKAADWKTGDTNRVAQSNISYSTANNTITVRATGDNNVCLSLDVEKCLYNVRGEYKYLVVKGKNLSTAAGKSYLWWLNGVNKWSSVAPSIIKTTDDGQTVFAWLLSDTGLDANCQGDMWNVCQGATIFGLTSTSQTATISYIGFVADVDEFITDVKLPTASNQAPKGIYNLAGVRLNEPEGHINIIDGKKVYVNHPGN